MYLPTFSKAVGWTRDSFYAEIQANNSKQSKRHHHLFPGQGFGWKPPCNCPMAGVGNGLSGPSKPTLLGFWAVKSVTAEGFCDLPNSVWWDGGFSVGCEHTNTHTVLKMLNLGFSYFWWRFFNISLTTATRPWELALIPALSCDWHRVNGIKNKISLPGCCIC